MKRFILGFVIAATLASTFAIAQQFQDLIARRICLGSALATCNTVRSGAGSPESSVTGLVGDVYLRNNGGSGTSLYVKESGSGNTGWTAILSAAGGSVPVTATSTTTFTNKTYDAEGTGNIFSIPVKLWIPAAVCNNATASAYAWSLPTSNAATVACQTGTNTQKATLEFPDGANSISAQTTFMLPADWTATGGVDVLLRWYAGTATSGNVVWQVATICVGDGSTSDPAFNTASTVTDAAKGTINQDNDATITGLTVTGCTAGTLMYLKVFRDPTNGSDTMSDTAHLRGIELTIRRAI